jgi:hypothetical protein
MTSDILFSRHMRAHGMRIERALGLPFSVPLATPVRSAVTAVVAKGSEKAGEFLLEHGFDDGLPPPIP